MVDGPGNDKTLYTIQNQILSFNKRYLTPIEVIEPPPAFPVGSKFFVHTGANNMMPPHVRSSDCKQEGSKTLDFTV